MIYALVAAVAFAAGVFAGYRARAKLAVVSAAADAVKEEVEKSQS